MFKRTLVAICVCAALAGGLFISQRRTGPLKVSGFVESDEIRVGSRVGGRVKSVLVEEGDEVPVGRKLVELEPFQLFEQRAQARGELAQAQADADRYQDGYQVEEIEQSHAKFDQLAAARDRLADGEEDIAAAQANLDLAEAQLDLAKTKYNRTESLFGKNSAAQNDMDQASSELRVARATVRVRQQEFAKVKRSRPSDLKEAEARVEEARQEWLLRKGGYRKEDKARAEAALAAAKASLAAIERQIEELTILAPAAGTIDAVDLRPGDLVGANTAAISMIERDRLWIRAYVPENRLDVKVGHPVKISVDSFPGKEFKGHVTFVSQQAEFTPGNVQTPEDRSKQVFRIKVLLDEGLGLLRPGMVGDVVLDSRAAK
jgi:membrane fusion protein YbhG